MKTKEEIIDGFLNQLRKMDSEYEYIFIDNYENEEEYEKFNYNFRYLVNKNITKNQLDWVLSRNFKISDDLPNIIGITYYNS